MSRAQPIATPAARRLLMHGQGLLSDPARPATPARVLAEIRALGYVQLDSINIVERAHHHILWSRLHQYRPVTLDALQRRGQIFEHWTHDASVLPSELFPFWRARFGHVAWGAWLRRKMGADAEALSAAVLDRVRREGPLMARDFEHPGRRSGPWWDWKPAKAALEYWWRRGELAIPMRENFQKVYDLTERVLPRVHHLPAPSREELVEWACLGALERLGAATAREIAGFWGSVTIDEARAWSRRAIAEGRAVAAALEHTGDGPTRQGVALPDWKELASRLDDPPRGMRLLSPFDPLIRDRARCERLFGFAYRFEAFVPAPRRRHGYYVLPVLEGERIVARVDPRLDRDTSTLHARLVGWESGVRPTRARLAALDAALERYAGLLGAAEIVRM